MALLKTPDALRRARDERWYHAPAEVVKRRLKDRWPPRVLAFYQGFHHGSEAYGVRYFASVREIEEVTRRDLFPEEPDHPNASWGYYRILIGALQKLDKPIWSRRMRRIIFIPTTWQKFVHAVEINDLYDESPLEDRLWAELKNRAIPAERQEYVSVDDREYALDFAFYGVNGKLDVETDGDTWHSTRERIAADNLRDNDLETHGWKLLRFNTAQVCEQMQDYCIPTICKTINQLGGLEDDGPLKRRFSEGSEDVQLDLSEYLRDERESSAEEESRE